MATPLSIEPVARRARTAAADRRRQLIDAAEKVFLDKGYHAARMDDVAKTIGMSKKTIYQIFPSKEDLFEALLHERIAPVDVKVRDVGRPIEEILREVLLKCCEFIVSPQQTAIFRLIMAEYLHSPELGRMYHRLGSARIMTALEEFLGCVAKRGTHHIDNPREMARMLIGMTIGSLHFEILVGIRQTPSRAMLKRNVDRTVAIFLKGSVRDDS